MAKSFTVVYDLAFYLSKSMLEIIYKTCLSIVLFKHKEACVYEG